MSKKFFITLALAGTLAVFTNAAEHAHDANCAHGAPETHAHGDHDDAEHAPHAHDHAPAAHHAGPPPAPRSDLGAPARPAPRPRERAGPAHPAPPTRRLASREPDPGCLTHPLLKGCATPPFSPGSP